MKEQLEIGMRIEELRKSEKLSRPKFGKKIGRTDDAIYNIEKGRAKIADETLELICDIFRVNKIWLEKGEGEMYKIKPSDLRFGEAVDRIIDSEELSSIVMDLIKLSDEKIDIIKKLVSILSENEKK